MLVIALAVESELKDFHSGEAGAFHKSAHLIGDNSKVLGDDSAVEVKPVEDFRADALHPPADFCGRCTIRHGVVAFKRAEVVDADFVEELQLMQQSVMPPHKAVRLLFFPVVQRIAPQLPVGGEVIGRHAGDLFRAHIFVEPEYFGVRPDVRAVVRDVDGDIADKRDVFGFCVVFKRG